MVECNRCKIEKDESEFNYNKAKKRVEYHCKKCHSDYLKSHYLKNKAYYKQKAIKRMDELRTWFLEYKSKLGCENCGESHPACLDFHHLKDKEIEVSVAIARGWTKNRILKEIDKCIVLCSNCHRKLHWK